MRIDRVLAILDTLNQFDALSGGVGTNLANVVFWSCLPRMTCYRYLYKLTLKGYVKQSVGKYRNQNATMYAITERGKKFLKGQIYE